MTESRKRDGRRGLSAPAAVAPLVAAAATSPAAVSAECSVRLTRRGSASTSNGTRVTYRVDEIATYPTRALPVAKVYGPTSSSTLRIVTCGGTLRPGQQLGNVAVYGHQTSVQS